MDLTMRYDIQTDTEDHAMKVLSPEQIDELIQEKVDKSGPNTGTWDALAAEMRRQGIKSARTGKPLTATTIKLRYYNMKKLEKAGGEGFGEATKAEKALSMIRMFMSLKTDEKSKIQLIQQVLEGNGDTDSI